MSDRPLPTQSGFTAIRHILAAYRSTDAHITEEEITAAWAEFDALHAALREWQDSAAKASLEVIAADKKIASLSLALREAIGWSYGEDVTPERRDELERLIDG